MTAEPVIALIAAVDRGGVIGKDNGLPWRLPADLKWFKANTMGKPVVMGRATCDSIKAPLPGRTNIVISRSAAALPAGFLLARSPEDAIALAGGAPEIMIAGGAQIFAAFLPRARRIYLTEIHHGFAGDTFFPRFDRAQWFERHRERRAADEKNPHAMDFVILERR